MRHDRQAYFRRFMREVLARGDWTTLRSRPTRMKLAALVRVCERSITTYTKLAIELGYLTVTEAGTTAKIRAGRCYPAPDPHAGEGNRAQEFQLHVPAEAADQAAESAPERVEETRISAGQRKTCAPSPRTLSTRGKDLSSHVVTTATTTTRVRGFDRQDRAAAKAEKSQAAQRRSRPAGRQPWQACPDEVSAVWRVFPAELVQLLAVHEAPRIANAIAAELSHRTVTELGERITRHWAYWRYKLAAGLVRSPAAIAFRLVRRDFECPDIRCEDRWHLDLDAPCKACELKAEEINAARRADRRTVEAVRSPAVRTAPRRPYDAPVITPRPDRCDPNAEFLAARQALKRRLGAAALRAPAGRRAIA